MKARSLKLIEEVIINSGVFSSLEISQDSIYVEFRNVELGAPKGDEDLSLNIRFAEDSFFSVFYDNIWDIDFLSAYDFKKQLLSVITDFKIKNIKFLDFEYLNKFFTEYSKEKSISTVEDFSIHNIRNDFFVFFETEEIAVVAGGNQMDFFTPHERIDDDILKELSNQWMLYFLQYNLKRKLIKDPMCENHPLSYSKK